MTGDQLNAVFGALADPTRRAILARLTDGDLSVARAGRPVRRHPAGHLEAPQGAGGRRPDLPHEAGDGPAQPPRRPAPLRDATEWLVGYREYWEESFERLDALLASLTAPPTTSEGEGTNSMNDHRDHRPSRASRSSTSSGSSTPRATSSSAPTPTRSSRPVAGPGKFEMIVERVGRPRRWSPAATSTATPTATTRGSTASSTARRRRTTWSRRSSSRARPDTSRSNSLAARGTGRSHDRPGALGVPVGRGPRRHGRGRHGRRDQRGFPAARRADRPPARR